MSFACLLSAFGLDGHDRLDTSRSDLSALPQNLRVLALGLDHRSMPPCCTSDLLAALVIFGPFSTFALLAAEGLVF